MSNYRIVIKISVKSDLKKIKNSNLKDQFDDVIDVLKENPHCPNQSFEKLQPKNQARYSRRINQQHRVVYKVDEKSKQVELYSAWSYYE